MRYWLCLLVLATSACSSFPTREGYAQKVYYWQGKDANTLLMVWTLPPDRHAR